MNTIQDLLKSIDVASFYDQSTFPRILKYGKENYISAYNDFIKLSPIQPEEPSTICIEKLPEGTFPTDDTEEEPVTDAYDVFISTIEDGQKEAYSMSFIDWNILAGYAYDFGDVPLNIAVMEFLWELTFYGSEEKMKEQREVILSYKTDGKIISIDNLDF